MRRREMSKHEAMTMLVVARDCLGSWAKLAAEIGVSRAYMSDVVRGNRELGPKILDYLGLVKTMRYEVTYKIYRKGVRPSRKAQEGS